MSYNYTQYVQFLANMLAIPASDPNYVTALTNIIDDAEQRIYRELDLLNTVITDATGTLTTNNQQFTLPQSNGRFVTVNSFHVGSTPLVRAMAGYLDTLFPQGSPSGFPAMYAMLTDQIVMLGPPPNSGYPVTVVGTIRPTPLSATNQNTYLSLYLPDLFLAESLIFGYGYMKDYGAMADDPKASVSWTAHYNDLWASANGEENRKRFGTAGWWKPEVVAQVAAPGGNQ